MVQDFGGGRWLLQSLKVERARLVVLLPRRRDRCVRTTAGVLHVAGLAVLVSPLLKMTGRSRLPRARTMPRGRRPAPWPLWLAMLPRSAMADRSISSQR